MVSLNYHQSECQGDVTFVNFPCVSENVSCQWASVDPPVNCVNCEWRCIGVPYAKRCREIAELNAWFLYNPSLSPLAKIPTKTKNFRSISDSGTIQAFINTDTRRFKIQTSDIGLPPPPRQSLSTKSHVITHDNFAFRKGLIVSGLMHNSPAKAMLACLNPWICFYPLLPFYPLAQKHRTCNSVLPF